MQFIEILLFGTGVFKYSCINSYKFYLYFLNFVCLYAFRNVCIGDKLLRPFVRECYERNTVPSVSDFYEWCQSVKKPKSHTDIYIFLQYVQVFNRSHIYLHFRSLYVSSWSTAQQSWCNYGQQSETLHHILWYIQD